MTTAISRVPSRTARDDDLFAGLDRLSRKPLLFELRGFGPFGGESLQLTVLVSGHQVYPCVGIAVVELDDFAQPPGPPRGNMNPPLFQLLIRPLTAFPLPAAATIFRVLNILALCGCIWWLARTSDERWTMADYGALLAWAPMASVIALNQLTWILWPPLLWAWWCWRQDRRVAGAIGYGLALSLKPFLGVILLWLLVTKRWSAAIVTCAVGALSFAVGLAVYRIDVNLAWIEAIRDVTWAYAGMNAALQGLLVRAMTKPIPISVLLVFAPALVGPLAAAGGALIVIVTLIRTRRQHID